MTSALDVSLATLALGVVLMISGCTTTITESVSMGVAPGNGGYICPLTGEELP